eukprot:6199171-Pleurochrysis_carterae.AAC.3
MSSKGRAAILVGVPHEAERQYWWKIKLMLTSSLSNHTAHMFWAISVSVLRASGLLGPRRIVQQKSWLAANTA